MTILITGGAGYIGSHTCVEFLKAGYNIIVLDNFCNSDRQVIDYIKQISSKNFKYYECDLCNKAQINRIFMENKIDSVIHFAGLKSVPESVKNPLKYYENNITGTINLLDAMNSHQVVNIVFSSSATVYGMNNKVPYNEDMPLSATNPYGWTKVMIEQIIKDYAAANTSFRVAILRYFNPIGAHPSGLLGEKPEGLPSNLMPYICQTSIGKLPYLKVCGTDFETKDGTGIRDYIHVCDIANGHLKALELLNKKSGVFIYNLGSGTGTSVLELITTFEKVNEMQLPRMNCNRRPGDISVSYADIHKAKKELGWKINYTLEDMCRDSWNYIKKFKECNNI
ncbi:MAG: galE [Anaerocolumna sp.]|jgi:UDP-glucose 4-epimerase|nr:galE [Anaerocolumna sp.]